MNRPSHAMIASAGLGTRMCHLTAHCPKALVRCAGKTLLDHQLDRLADAGVGKSVVNVHHFADQIEAHLTDRKPPPDIQISDERNCLLETGGGLIRAAQYLGDQPFFVMNVDAIWSGHPEALGDLARFKSRVPQALAVLLLARRSHSLGLTTDGDFHMVPGGQISRKQAGETALYYYAGVQIFDPELLSGFKQEKFSTNLFWDKALSQGRLYGMELDGFWMHVGDPESLVLAEQHLTKGT